MPSPNRRGHNFKKDPAKVKPHAHTIKFTDAENERLEAAYKAAKMKRMDYMRKAVLAALDIDVPVVQHTTTLTPLDVVLLVEKLRSEGMAIGDIAKQAKLPIKKVREILGLD
jgi:hypothetical protein